MDLPNQFKDSVRKQLNTFFPEDMPESFVDAMCAIIAYRNREELRKFKDYSDEKFLNYLQKGSKLSLTPNMILVFTRAIQKLAGEKAFRTMPKYAKAQELFDIIPVLLAIKKTTGIECMAHLRDDPDIEIIPAKGLEKYTHKEFTKIEFMYIPTIVTDKWSSEDSMQELVKFVVKKKYSKRYGANVSLVFHAAINNAKISLKELSNAFSQVEEKNPYDSISAIVVPSRTEKIVAFVKLYPNLAITSMSHKEQLALLY